MKQSHERSAKTPFSCTLPKAAGAELLAERLKVNECLQESKIMARRRRKIEPMGKDEDVRMMAGLITAGVVSIILLASVLIAPPANVGPEEGSLAPDFVASAYDGGNWEEVRLSQLYDGRYVLITFLDTDCPHCWTEAEYLSQIYDETSGEVMFVTIAVELQISGHESTREEVEAFRDKSQFGDNQNNGDGCYSGRKNCAERPGSPHPWMYVDDLGSSIASDWELPGTPFNLILDGDGTVVWNQAERPGEDMRAALLNLLQESE